MSPLRKYSLRVASAWKLIVVLAAVGGGLAAVWSITTATTTWTASTALSSQSATRGPEQDAVLAVGYADYFNQESYQQLLRAKANVPDDVTLSAQTGASSPILYIRASGGSEGAVRESVVRATEAYREDVRQGLIAERRRAADDLQAEIDKDVAILQTPATDVQKNVLLDQIRSLQGRVTEFLADDTNHLKQLQSAPGVFSSTPSPMADVASGVFGGALLGVLIALAVAVFDRRVRNTEEAQEAAGVPMLAELQREEDSSIRMQNLLNSVINSGSATTVIAVVCARRSAALAGFADELAKAWPARRGGVLHVLSDLRYPRPEYEAAPGLTDVLHGQTTLFDCAIASGEGKWVLPPGDVTDLDPYAVVDPRLFVALLHDASSAVELVVVEAPPLLEAPESQSICAAADQVILLVEEGVTPSDDVSEAVSLLKSGKAQVAGVVIDQTQGELAAARSAVATPDSGPDAPRLAPRDGAAVLDVPAASNGRTASYPQGELVATTANGSIGPNEANGSKDET